MVSSILNGFEMDYYNYYILKRLIENRKPIKSGDNSFGECNGSRKLIKLEGSIKYYNYYPQYKNEKLEDGFDNSIFKKIKMGCGSNDDSRNVIKEIQDFPLNYTDFDLLCSVEEFEESFISNNKERDLKRFRGLHLTNQKKESLFRLLKQCPKRIIFSEITTLSFYISLIFQATNNSKMDLDSLLFSDYSSSPSNLSTLFNVNSNQTLSKLDWFKYSFEVFKFLTNNQQELKVEEKDNILKKWNLVIEKLINETTLLELEFGHFECKSELCICKVLQLSDIYDGFKKILTKSKSNIETFKIFTEEKVNTSLLQALANNTTIKSLHLCLHPLEYIVENVLFYNSTIRNLILEPNEDIDDLDEFFKLLQNEKYSSLEYYSVTISISRPSKKSILDLFNSFNYNIKELNIFNYYDDYDDYRKLSYQLISNFGTIINITEFKEVRVVL